MKNFHFWFNGTWKSHLVIETKKNTPKFAALPCRPIFTYPRSPRGITISLWVISQTRIFGLRVTGVALVREAAARRAVLPHCGISWYNQLTDYIVDETITDTITSDLHDYTCIRYAQQPTGDCWFATGYINLLLLMPTRRPPGCCSFCWWSNKIVGFVWFRTLFFF